MIGAGDILLVAHNWDFLSRPVRCAIAFVPLVLSQALGVFVLLRRNESAPWRESAAILNVAAIGTAIALVSQTYQIQGDFARFILVWMLLALPIVYLFRTSLGSRHLFCRRHRLGFFLENGDFFGAQPNDLWVWPLLLLGIPAFHNRSLRQNRNGYGMLLAAVGACDGGAFSLGQTDDFGAQSFWRCSFAGFWIDRLSGGRRLVPAIGEPTRPHPFVAFGLDRNSLARDLPEFSGHLANAPMAERRRSPAAALS